jgi:hypothetical protein
MPNIITKSDYLESLRCVKKLWREKEKPTSEPAPSPDARMRMEEGKQVGAAARAGYSDAVFVPLASREEMMAPCLQRFQGLKEWLR